MDHSSSRLFQISEFVSHSLLDVIRIDDFNETYLAVADYSSVCVG